MKKSLILFLFAAGLFFTSKAAEQYPFTVKQSGSGKQAIIFIPGFACSGDVWNETVEQFKSNHTCYVLTMAGFAGHAATTNPDIQNWIAEIAKYIKENRIEKPVIVGHSLGGVMAQALAASYPELVSKIVVVDALPCLPALSNPAFEASANPDCSKFVTSFAAMNDGQFYQMQKVNMTSMVADTAKLETVVQWSIKSDRNTMAQIYCQLLNTDMRAKISTVTCPALILLEPSFKALQSNIEGQYKNLKGAQLHYADKGLHFIMFDDKAWYFAELKKFIQ